MANKCSRLFWALFSKYFKFVIERKDKLVILNLNLMLLSIIKNGIFQKTYNKRYAFVFLNLNSFEIIFILLTKAIISYI